MYTIVKEPVVWIDVEWNSLDVGGPEEASVQVERAIRMKVVLLPRSEMLKSLPEVLGGSGEEVKDVKELCLDVVRDWAGVVDEDKRPLAFDKDLLAAIVENEPGFTTGFELSYITAFNGRGKVREKNSGGSPSNGRAEGAKAKPRPRRSKSS